MENKDQLATLPNAEIAEQLNNAIAHVTGTQGLAGFNKFYLLADGMQKLKALLTPEYMAPIMAMQGNRLGFKTDKDKDGGYLMEKVKNCIIEAVLMGLQPYGNQFNIIAGNMYMTKEGAGHILNNFKGLKYDLVCSLPRISADKTSAAVDVNIDWTLNGETKSKTIPIPIKMDAYTSVDSLIGKATRKGRAWLIGTITGIEVGDGDATENGTATVINTKIGKNTKSDEQHETERNLVLISEASNIEELEFYSSVVTPETKEAYDKKHDELSKSVKKK